MAILTEGRILVTDASDTPISGGKVRIYDTGTTNLTSVFSDEALSVPLTNPVVANSSGFTPVIFAAEATSVDVTYLTAADATVTGRTYTAIPFLGSDTGTFTRTLPGGTRFKITDGGGIVLMQVGDASPDNVGGQLTIEGWAGTQGDTLTLDFATTNTTGVITENSKKLLGIVNTNATTFTAVSSVDIPLTQNPSGVLCHEVEVFNLIASTTSVLGIQFSYDGGGTYKSGASDYAYAYQYKNLGDPNLYPTYSEDDAHTQILCNTSTDFTVKPAWLTLRILTVASGSNPTAVKGELMCLQGGGTGKPNLNLIRGYGLGGYGKATHMRLLASTGTITGQYRVAAMRGFGEA
jgi:hypothetical protein